MVTTETINLKDNVSGSAKSASDAVSGLSSEMTSLTKALSTAQNKMTVAQATGNIKGFKTAAADVNNLKAAISLLPPEANQAAAATAKAADATHGMASAADEAATSSGGFQAELGELTGGLSVVVEAVGAVALAFGAFVIAGASMAIKASEAKAKITSMFDALGEGKIKGTEAVAMLDQLGDQIGQTREQLAPLAKSFLAMGVTGTEQLKNLTLAAASAGALAEGGAESFTKLYEQANAAAATGSKFTVPYKKLETQLVSMGLNIDDLAASMGTTGEKLTKGLKAGTVSAKDFAAALQQAATTKGAGPLARAGASLTNVWAKFQENITELFEGLGPAIDPFLAQVKDLFDIFGKAKPSGDALKSGIGAFFTKVFEIAAKVVPLVKHFLLDLIIYGLKAYIALKPIVKWFEDLQNNKTVMVFLNQAFEGLKTAALVVAAAVATVVAIFLVLAAASFALGTALWAIVGTVIAFTTESIAKLGEWVTFAEDAAKNFVAGLISGIASGASRVVDSVTGLAGKAKDAFKSALGIASPSKEMMKLGAFAGQGVAEGLDASAGQVGASGAAVGASAFSGAASASPSGGGGGTTNNTSNSVNVSVQIDGAGKSAQDITEELVALTFERMALASGN